jgi:hypothetical protein
MADDKCFLPDYEGACVNNIVPSMLGVRDRSWFPEPARTARSVVLLVLDGFGWELYSRTRNALPNLDTFRGEAITTVAPSTTASVLTSIATGLAPAEHGVLGFRMRMDDEILNTIRWTTDSGKRAVDPLIVQRNEPFLRREVPVVTQAEHAGTGFTEAHLRGSRFVGWESLDDLCSKVVQLVDEGAPFVYSYYPKIDSTVHDHGLRDGSVEAMLATVDAAVGSILDRLPGDAALLITADHGGVHIEPDAWVPSTDLDGLVAFQAGEARFRYLWATEKRVDELAAAAREAYGDIAWVRTRDEAFAQWLGGPSTPNITRRVGDVIVAPFADVGLLDPGYAREQRLIGLHGSLTAAEMLVPLIAAPGRA